MTRFTKAIIIRGKGIELTEDEILRLEIELIESERMLDTNKLEYDPIREESTSFYRLSLQVD